jgi:hypothetical protein
MISIRQFAASAVLGTAMVVAGGCESDTRPDSVPYTATELGAGREVATFNATDAGTVYVVDHTRQEVVYSGRVKQGDMVRVDAKDNRVLVNGSTVTERDLLNDHKYKIFFQPGPETTATGDTVIRTSPEARTTITTDPDAQPAGTRIITSPDQKTTITTDPNAPAQPPPPQPKTSVTTDPDTGKTTITTDPNAAPPPQPKTTITTDPETGKTTIRQQPE